MLVRGLEIHCLASFSKYVTTQPALAIDAVQARNLFEGKLSLGMSIFPQVTSSRLQDFFLNLEYDHVLLGFRKTGIAVNYFH